VGHGMGMAKGMSSTYAANAAGVRVGTQSLGEYTTKVRKGDKDAKLVEDDEESA